MHIGLKHQQSDPLFAGAKLFAIGDLNNDKQNDIITVSEDQTKFSAHYFNQETYKFVSGQGNETAPPTAVSLGYKITQVQIGRGGEGASSSSSSGALQSLYVTMSNEELNRTEVHTYKQTERFKFSDVGQSIRIGHKSQPFFADLDGDLK